MKDEEIDENYLLALSQKTVYFWNNEDECFVKSVPGCGYFIKFPGKKEYALNSASNIVMRGIYSGKTVTEDEYEMNYFNIRHP